VRRVCHQPALLVLDQEVEEELRGFLQHGVRLAQEGGVATEGVVLERCVESQAAPIATAPAGAVDGRRRAPQVGVVVGDEAARP